jgi:hypothetical protein
MERADELVRLKRRIAEFEECLSEVEPVDPDCLSWSGPERAQLEELLTRTLQDMRGRRCMLEQPAEKQGPLEKVVHQQPLAWNQQPWTSERRVANSLPVGKRIWTSH